MTRVITLLFLITALLPAAPGEPFYRLSFSERSRIFFTGDHSGNEEIYLVTEGRLRNLTNHPASDRWPTVDPSGLRLLFTSNRSGNYDLYTLDLRNGRLDRLTFDPADELSPIWSPDGRAVLFDLQKENGLFVTYRLDLSSRHRAPLFPGAPYPSTIVPFPSSRSGEIFFTGKVLLGWKVAKYDPLRKRYVDLGERGSCRPRLSPDGKRIAYVSHRDDGLGDIFSMNTDGSQKTNLTPSRSRFYDYYPSFSPDGKRIVFSSSSEGKGKGSYQLYLLDLATRKVRRIFFSSGNNSFPFWAPPLPQP